MTAKSITSPERLGPPEPIKAKGQALFLDLDGTLARIVERPQDVHADPRRTALLKALVECFDRRVAIISGRPLDEIIAITQDAVPALAGVHGLQRRDVHGARSAVSPDPDLAIARDVFEALAAAQPGLLVEEKGLSITLHYRGRPGACEAVRDAARRLEASTNLILQEGDMVAEMRTPGDDKSKAVARFLAEPPFLGARPVFVGDDLTDENGFMAANLAGGFGVLVGPGRETVARYRLDDPDAVLNWLDACLRASR